MPIMTGRTISARIALFLYVRGRERSRTFEVAVIGECERLVADGVRETSFLVKTLTHMVATSRCFTLCRTFTCCGSTGVERIRFTSSNPKDLD